MPGGFNDYVLPITRPSHMKPRDPPTDPVPSVWAIASHFAVPSSPASKTQKSNFIHPALLGPLSSSSIDSSHASEPSTDSHSEPIPSPKEEQYYPSQPAPSHPQPHSSSIYPSISPIELPAAPTHVPGSPLPTRRELEPLSEGPHFEPTTEPSATSVREDSSEALSSMLVTTAGSTITLTEADKDWIRKLVDEKIGEAMKGLKGAEKGKSFVEKKVMKVEEKKGQEKVEFVEKKAKLSLEKARWASVSLDSGGCSFLHPPFFFCSQPKPRVSSAPASSTTSQPPKPQSAVNSNPKAPEVKPFKARPAPNFAKISIVPRVHVSAVAGVAKSSG